jgi:hypothetical protein
MDKCLVADIEQDFGPWHMYAEPDYWKDYNLTVIADRYNGITGQLHHLVLETVAENTVLGNALVFNYNKESLQP